MSLRKNLASLVASVLLASSLVVFHTPASQATEPNWSELTSADAPIASQSKRAPNGWAYDMVRANDAHDLGFTGEGVRVAILDNGIDARATGITSKVVDRFNALYVVNGLQEHGTATAGIVAAEPNTEAGIGGIAPDAEILDVQVCVLSNCRNEGMVAGLRWAIDNGADVVSMSLGGGSNDGAMAAMIQEATSKGIIVLAAAGNSACSAYRQTSSGEKATNCTQSRISIGYPASYSIDGLVSVGAVDRERKRASYSTFNAQVDVSAPGTGVSTTFPWGPNSDFGGTSAATPVVAGVAALIKQAAPSLTAAEIQGVLQISSTAATEAIPNVWDSCTWNSETNVWDCTNLSPAKWPVRYYTGAGVVDAVRAVETAQELVQVKAEGKLTAAQVTNEDAAIALDWSNSGLGAGPYKLLLDGNVVKTSASTSTKITELSNWSTYAVEVQDASGQVTPLTLATPGRTYVPAAKTLNEIRVHPEDFFVSSQQDLSGEYGGIILSDGTPVNCSSSSCQYSLAPFSGTGRYYYVDANGVLSAPSNAVAVTSQLLAPPQNLKFTDITETGIKISWDSVPGATAYRYYDAGKGEWLETAETSVEISGVKTGLFSTFRVAAEGGDMGNLISTWTPTYWYFTYPPELEPLSGLTIRHLSDTEVDIGFTPNPEAARIFFVRSDGKMQYMPGDAPGIMDRFNPEDAGKTFKYVFVTIDEFQWGMQYGKISEEITVTVPFPKKVDDLSTDLTNEPLQYETERDFKGFSSSGKQVWWWVEGPCQLVSQDGTQAKVRATGVNADCLVKGNTEEDATWKRGYIEIRIPLVKKVETVSLVGSVPDGLEYKKEVTLTAQGNTNRAVSWFVDGDCILVEAKDRWARFRANDGQGTCKVEARIYEDDWFTGANASVDQGMVLQKEKLTITAKSQIWDRRTISLRYETATGRTPVFKTTGLCRVVKVTKTHVQVASRFTFGSCVLNTTVPATRAEAGATSSTRVALLTHKPQRKADLFND